MDPRIRGLQLSRSASCNGLSDVACQLGSCSSRPWQVSKTNQDVAECRRNVPHECQRLCDPDHGIERYGVSIRLTVRFLEWVARSQLTGKSSMNNAISKHPCSSQPATCEPMLITACPGATLLSRMQRTGSAHRLGRALQHSHRSRGAIGYAYGIRYAMRCRIWASIDA